MKRMLEIKYEPVEGSMVLIQIKQPGLPAAEFMMKDEDAIAVEYGIWNHDHTLKTVAKCRIGPDEDGAD